MRNLVKQTANPETNFILYNIFFVLICLLFHVFIIIILEAMHMPEQQPIVIKED
jgi:hypothetical protein